MTPGRTGGPSGRGRAGGGQPTLSLDLTETYVFLGADGRATAVPLTEAFWEEMSPGPSGGPSGGAEGRAAAPLAGKPDSGAGSRHPAAPHPARHRGDWFVSSFWLEADMATWERHPKGDRLVVAQSGSFTLVLDHQNGSGRRRLPLVSVGSVLVPCGCWHRLTVNTPGLVLFISPTHGMELRPV